MKLLEMSLSGAFLILVIVIIRALALYRLPKRTFLALWAIALIRLLISFSISSRLSVYTLVNFLKTKLSGTGTSRINTLLINSGMVASTVNTTLEKTSSPHISPYVVIWLIGLLICVLVFIGTHPYSAF